MKRAFGMMLGVVVAFGLAGQAFAADVKLKSSINVDSSEVRLSDLFDGAGDAGDAVFGMAPGLGRSMSYSASYVQAKARQAGLDWSNPEAISTVTITRAASDAEAQSDAAEAEAFAREANAAAPKSVPVSSQGADLKRGDSVQIVYRAPGVQLTTMGKALTDARIGGKARAANARSNKTIEGVLVAPGRIEAFSMNSGPAQVTALNGAH